MRQCEFSCPLLARCCIQAANAVWLIVHDDIFCLTVGVCAAMLLEQVVSRVFILWTQMHKVAASRHGKAVTLKLHYTCCIAGQDQMNQA